MPGSPATHTSVSPALSWAGSWSWAQAHAPSLLGAPFSGCFCSCLPPSVFVCGVTPGPQNERGGGGREEQGGEEERKEEKEEAGVGQVTAPSASSLPVWHPLGKRAWSRQTGPLRSKTGC